MCPQGLCSARAALRVRLPDHVGRSVAAEHRPIGTRPVCGGDRTCRGGGGGPDPSAGRVPSLDVVIPEEAGPVSKLAQAAVARMMPGVRDDELVTVEPHELPQPPVRVMHLRPPYGQGRASAEPSRERTRRAGVVGAPAGRGGGCGGRRGCRPSAAAAVANAAVRQGGHDAQAWSPRAERAAAPTAERKDLLDIGPAGRTRAVAEAIREGFRQGESPQQINQRIKVAEREGLPLTLW